MVIAESMGDTDSHFKDNTPINESTRISAILGRAGQGTNRGSYWGTAKLTPNEIARRVDADKEALRSLLNNRSLPTDRALDMEPL